MQSKNEKTTCIFLNFMMNEKLSNIRSGSEGLPLREFSVDSLSVKIFPNEAEMAAAAADEVGDYLIRLLGKQEFARLILATGNSQIEFLKRLIDRGEIDWSRIVLFHMDEYLGISANHPASFQRYMSERVESIVRPKAFHYLAGDVSEPIEECARYAELLGEKAIDLCCLGVGENGHLAFNDPPVAKFEDPYQVKIVKLDLACKAQQVGEGHFPSLESVPSYALTLTIPALFNSRKMICLAPEKRKAKAIENALTEPISARCPASFLRRQSQATLYLDVNSAMTL